MHETLLPGEILPGVRAEAGRITLRPDTPEERDARLDLRATDDLRTCLADCEAALPGIDHTPTRRMVERSIEIFRAALARRGE